MSKRKKKSGNKKDSTASTINLITALVNLVIAILLLIEKLTEEEAGGEIPLSLQDNTKNAQCQTTMTTIIYILCGVSITLSVISIIISIKGRQDRGREKKKD